MTAESRFEKQAHLKQELAKKISWPSQEPITFMLRRGGHSESYFQNYDRQHAPENLQAMADAGVRFARLHFYKGFGLEMEGPEIRKSRDMAELMRRLGMTVSVYVGGTMFVETFYREVPEAREWEQRDLWDQPAYYSRKQTFRRFACPNEPAYRDYIKKVLRVAVQEIKADQIFFDNIFLLPEPKSCRCPRCLKAFGEFLSHRYPTPESAVRRFGYPSADYVTVNEWDLFNGPETLATLDDPILQEWARFRCESLARHCAELYDYVKGLNPKIAVGFNLKGIYGLNRIWHNAVYHPLHSGTIDFSPFDFAGMEARLDSKTGALVSEIRSYKMARTLGFSYEAGGGPLELALLMAFNPQKNIPGYGYQGGPHNSKGLERSFSPETEFFREYNDRYFVDTEGIADVAVLRTWPSMAYSISATLVPTILMEQVLIQHKVPFDIIFDEQFGKIGRYRAVILAGQESLSESWIELLTNYMQNGGTVVFTGNTADYNDWRERRTSNPLVQLLGGSKPTSVLVKPVGKGKLVYIPAIVPASRPPHGPTFPETRWVLPKNHESIHRAIVDNLPDEPSIITTAPLSTVLEVWNRPQSNETIVHFVQFDDKLSPAPFQVRLRNQFVGRKAAGVNLFTPEADNSRPLPYVEQDGWITFKTVSLKTYSMVVISYE